MITSVTEVSDNVVSIFLILQSNMLFGVTLCTFPLGNHAPCTFWLYTLDGPETSLWSRFRQLKYWITLDCFRDGNMQKVALIKVSQYFCRYFWGKQLFLMLDCKLVRYKFIVVRGSPLERTLWKSSNYLEKKAREMQKSGTRNVVWALNFLVIRVNCFLKI
jgi:hypothetical protein